MTVTQETRQLKLPFGTAENRGKSKPKSDGGVEAHLRAPEPFAEPKPNGKSKQIQSVTMEEIVEWLEIAFSKVASNKGAPGPDRQSITTRICC